MKHILALLVLLTGTIATHCQPARAYSDAGSIFIERAGSTDTVHTVANFRSVADAAFVVN